MDDWSGIDKIDSSLCKALRGVFSSPLHVSAAFDELEAAQGLVDDALGNSYGAARRDASARALLDWKDTSGGRLEFMRREGMQERVSHGKLAEHSSHINSISDSYDGIVASSPMHWRVSWRSVQRLATQPEQMRRTDRRRNGPCIWLR